MDAARQQNWDPSVQALVAFPNVLTLLTSNVHWMTDLGNAFLAQQQDVDGGGAAHAHRAQSNGRLCLQSTADSKHRRDSERTKRGGN